MIADYISSLVYTSQGIILQARLSGMLITISRSLRNNLFYYLFDLMPLS